MRTLFYSSDDWNIMETALLRASKKLNRSKDHVHTDRLARRVKIFFDRGLVDPDAIASAAVNQELLISDIAALRSSARPSNS
jgi:hypothetical protein